MEKCKACQGKTPLCRTCRGKRIQSGRRKAARARKLSSKTSDVNAALNAVHKRLSQPVLKLKPGRPPKVVYGSFADEIGAFLRARLGNGRTIDSIELKDGVLKIVYRVEEEIIV